MNKINVLQIADRLGIGGSEKVLQTFTECLDKSFFDVSVCGIFDGGVRAENLNAYGIQTHIVHNQMDELAKLMRDKRIHIVHMHRSGGEQPFAIHAARKAGVPVIIETNVFGLHDHSETGRSIDMHLLISKTVALKYLQNAGISMVDFVKNNRVLYNPVDVKKFQRYGGQTEKESDQFRSIIGIEKNVPIIARVGRPDITKWSRFSIDMLTHLIRKLPEAKYLIIGGIPAQIKKKIEKSHIRKNIVDIGFLSEKDLITAYHTIDILAHSSWIGESFGLTIAEAMASGKTVVVNSTPWADNAQIELVDNGVTGFVANTPRTYADAIAYLIENKKEAALMGVAAYAKVTKEYEAKKITNVLEKTYVELLEKKSRNVYQAIIKKYENVDYYPTDIELLNYSKEYKERLLNQFGRPTFSEKLSLELNYHGGLRSLKHRTERECNKWFHFSRYKSITKTSIRKQEMNAN